MRGPIWKPGCALRRSFRPQASKRRKRYPGFTGQAQGIEVGKKTAGLLHGEKTILATASSGAAKFDPRRGRWQTLRWSDRCNVGMKHADAIIGPCESPLFYLLLHYAAQARPARGSPRLLVISLDGMRPDYVSWLTAWVQDSAPATVVGGGRARYRGGRRAAYGHVSRPHDDPDRGIAGETRDLFQRRNRSLRQESRWLVLVCRRYSGADRFGTPRRRRE